MNSLDGAISNASTPTKKVLLYGTPDFYLEKLEEDLGRGDAEPEAFERLLERLTAVWLDAERQSLLLRVEQLAPTIQPASFEFHSRAELRQLPDDMQELLTSALVNLVSDAEKLVAKDRVHADRAVARLSRLLTNERAWKVVSPWFGDRRAFRRRTVIRVLRQYGVPDSHAGMIVEEYRATLDRELLKLISFNPPVAALLTEEDVINALAIPANDRKIGLFVLIDDDARYWRMRAIEAYLVGGHMPSQEVAFGSPMEFAWAVGRGSHREALPLLLRILQHLHENPEFVWRALRALERVGEPEDIQRAHDYAAALITSRNAEISQAAA